MATQNPADITTDRATDRRSETVSPRSETVSPRSETVSPRPEAPAPRPEAPSLVVCSLEPWSDVRRRIRILVDELVELDPTLHVLFVAPAIDISHQLRTGRLTGLGGPRLRETHPRIHVLEPRKWLPRLVGPFADRSLERQILDAVAELGLQRPLLWVNDASYARVRRCAPDGPPSTTSPTTGCWPRWPTGSGSG